MHRLFAFLSVIVLLLPLNLFSQEQEEEPLPPRHAESKLGGGAGFTPFWLFFDPGPLNQVLGSANAAALAKGGMPLYGGQGYGYIMFLPNVRVGGLGASGSMETKMLDVNKILRDVQVSVGFGGVTIDYVAPITPRLDVTFGMLLGHGSMEIIMTRDNGTAKVWDDLWGEYGSQQAAQNFTRKLTGSFFAYQPSVNLEYAVLRWLGVRLGVSYSGMAAASWKLDDTYDTFGVPDNISGKGLMINTGVFVGTFMF